jgi:hypothetical protein
MPVATAAPTEAEIRERVAASVAASKQIEIGEWVSEMTLPLRAWGSDDSPTPMDRALVLWTDLRPSEAEDLAREVEAIYRTADVLERDAVAAITEMIVAAALGFAREHPNAPRVVREQAAS